MAVIGHNPLLAFAENIEANSIFPWDWHIRYQLLLTFRRLALTHDVRMDQGSLDRLYEISATATPYSPLLKEVRGNIRLEKQ